MPSAGSTNSKGLAGGADAGWLEALPGPAAVLDASGVIVAANAAWRAAAARPDAGGEPVVAAIGVSYISACDAAAAAGREGWSVFARGLRDVAAGQRPSAEIDAGAPSSVDRAGGTRGWRLRARAYMDSGERRVLVWHEETGAFPPGHEHAEEELRQSEERFRQLTENIREVFWLMDWTRRRTLYVSPAFEAIWGRPRRWVYEDPRAWLSMVHPDDRRLVQQALDADAGRGGYDVRYRIIRDDGQVRWIHDRAFPVRNSAQEVYRVAGIAEDITDQREAEQALRDSEERLRFAQECAGAGSWEWDVVTGRAIWSESFCMLLGFDPSTSEPSYESWIARVAPEDREGADRRFREAVYGTSALFRMEYRVAHPQLGVRTLADQGRIIRSSDGRPLRVAGISFDVTDLRRAEERLRASEQRLAALVRQSPLAVVACDVHLRIVEWNPAAEKMFGWSANEIVGQDAWIIVPEHERPRVRQVVDALWAQTGGVRFTNENVTKDGRRILCDWYNSPLVDAHGKVVGVASVCQDITETRRLEDDRRQAQKMEAIGQLAGGVAHDFNNLLTAIFGYTDLAKRTIQPSHPATRSLERVEEAARHATGVTRALLTFSRQSTGEKKPMQLAQAVEESVRLLRRTLPANVQLVTSVPGDHVVWVNADPTQLQQVVLNLAINARDAMPKGGRLEIAVSTAARGRGGEKNAPAGSAVLTIRDTGVGIPPAIRARLFEPFLTTKPPGQGTGLGLSITYAIVKDHDGTIAVESVEGEGTTFRVFLPLAEAPAAAGPAAAAREPLAQGGGELVLLADDNQHVREIVASMLRTIGYRVAQAADGDETLAALRHLGSAVRLLVLDQDMPGCDGAECLARLNAQGRCPPAIIITGDPAFIPPPGLQRWRVLRKPFQIAELASAVAGALLVGGGALDAARQETGG